MRGRGRRGDGFCCAWEGVPERMDREETKLTIQAAIGSIACPALSPYGFKRRGPKSEDLTRRHGDFQQRISFFWGRPRYGDDPSDAHLTPYVALGNAELHRVQQVMGVSENLVQGYPDSIFA